MLVLFDHGTPNGLARALTAHTIQTAQSRGWDTLTNGALLNVAEAAGFAVLLATDRRIRYQQHLLSRRLSLVVLTGSTKWSRVRHHADRIAAAVAGATPGSTPKSRFPSSRNPTSCEWAGADAFHAPRRRGCSIFPLGNSCQGQWT